MRSEALYSLVFISAIRDTRRKKLTGADRLIPGSPLSHNPFSGVSCVVCHLRQTDVSGFIQENTQKLA